VVALICLFLEVTPAFRAGCSRVAPDFPVRPEYHGRIVYSSACPGGAGTRIRWRRATLAPRVRSGRSGTSRDFGISVSMAIGAVIPIETLCGSAGIGQLVWQSALARDLPVLVHLTVLVALATSIANFLSDIARALVTREQ